MLSLDERLGILDEILSSKTPDEILAELHSYPAIGPTVEEFTENFPMTLQEHIKAAAEKLLAESKTDSTVLNDYTCCQIAETLFNDKRNAHELRTTYEELDKIKVPFLDSLDIPPQDKKAASHLSAFLSFITRDDKSKLHEYRVQWLEFIIANIEGIK
ncbi:hypothetical protein [Vibrio phage XZ1]|nr:hypothetical protein [Vibrio phage XZ1]